MNLRKFYFITCAIVSLFLFLSGTVILTYLNTYVNKDNSLMYDILKPFISEKEAFNTLVLVGDKDEYNTDTMLLVNFNPSTAKISLLSIPRDTKVKIKGSSLPKINSAYGAGGAKLSVSTVSSLLNVNIKYYVYFNISSFREIIDLLEGVDIYVPIDMVYDDPIQNLHINLKKGQQHLDGEKAEQFLRFRHPNGSYSKEMLKYYDGSDLKRIDAQQNFIKELIRQKVSVYYVTKLNSIINVIFKNIKTNITLNEALKMSHNLGQINPDELSTFKLSGDDRTVDGIWYFVHDDKIMDMSTNKLLDQNEVMKQYFSSGESLINSNDTSPANEKDTDTKKPSTTTKKSSTSAKATPKNNPSNSESSIKGSPTAEP